jgi:hypothetical protein
LSCVPARSISPRKPRGTRRSCEWGVESRDRVNDATRHRIAQAVEADAGRGGGPARVLARAPVSLHPDAITSAWRPVPGRPRVAGARRQEPRAGDPRVRAAPPGPVARDPDVRGPRLRRHDLRGRWRGGGGRRGRWSRHGHAARGENQGAQQDALEPAPSLDQR